jgi:uncharacterized protein YbjQ (UPF0145 family)
VNQMLISLDHLQSPEIEIGELLTVVVVNSANIIKDIQSNVKDMIGGRMKHYEKMIQDAVDMALKELEQKAKNCGYDGVIGVKIASPTVVNGGAEVIVYGNGFKNIN